VRLGFGNKKTWIMERKIETERFHQVFRIGTHMEPLRRWEVVRLVMPTGKRHGLISLAAGYQNDAKRRCGGIFGSFGKVQIPTRPGIRFIGILHPEKLQHAIGKVKPPVGSALTRMGIARPFLKTLFQEPICFLGCRLNQDKDMVQLHIYVLVGLSHGGYDHVDLLAIWAAIV